MMIDIIFGNTAALPQPIVLLNILLFWISCSLVVLKSTIVGGGNYIVYLQPPATGSIYSICSSPFTVAPSISFIANIH